MKVSRFRIRASYPNYFMVQLYAHEGRSIFDHDSEDPDNQLEGNKPGTVIYRLEGEPDDVWHEFPPRWYDMYRLLRLSGEARKHCLEMLLEEQATGQTPQELTVMRDDFRKECMDYVAARPLTDGDYLITTLTPGQFTDEEISYKGRPEAVLYLAIDNPKHTAMLSSYTTTPIARRILLDIITALKIPKQEDAIEKDLEWNDKITYPVPNVIGMSLTDAKKQLFNFEIITEGEGDIVFEQSPKAGEILEDRSKVRIILK